jgi:hypothetical protein
MADYGTKTLNEYDTFDPVRNLWRNVLVVAISDAIKIKSRVIKFSEFYKNKTFYELDYVTLPNRDFDAVCNMSNLDGNLVRKKVNKLMKEMEKKNGSDMPEMPWKRLYQSKGFNRESDGNYTPMSTM